MQIFVDYFRLTFILVDAGNQVINLGVPSGYGIVVEGW
jgi:hypothetical protein